jgi:hypothetical protein
MGLKKREYGDVTGSSIVLNCVVWATLVYIKLLIGYKYFRINVSAWT